MDFAAGIWIRALHWCPVLVRSVIISLIVEAGIVLVPVVVIVCRPRPINWDLQIVHFKIVKN